MLDVFDLRGRVIDEYAAFSRSFTRIAAPDIAAVVEAEYARERYWPEPLIQINPNYRRNGTVADLVRDGMLHRECERLFQANKAEGTPRPIELYTHQLEALAKAKADKSFVVTTGTGSGKSLPFFLPIIDRILRARADDPRPRTRAIVIYPTNALANSQLEELGKFLCDYPEGGRPFSVARYTGQEERSERERIAQSPPDILLTNFMMLELILTRFEPIDRRVVENCSGLEFLVLDELHTYRGRQGADVAMLVRRLRQRLSAEHLLCIGTSATMPTTGTIEDQNKTVAEVASKLFGAPITAHDVIGETLERVTDDTLDLTAIRPLLAARITAGKHEWQGFDDFRRDPLAVWLELTLGVAEYRGDNRRDKLTEQDYGMQLVLQMTSTDRVAWFHLECEADGRTRIAHAGLDPAITDLADRKMVAAVLAGGCSAGGCNLVNACDTDWYDWQVAMEAADVYVEQLIHDWCHAKWLAKQA